MAEAEKVKTIIEEYYDRKSSKLYNESWNRAKRLNYETPCPVCNNLEFVNLYRRVNGEIKGNAYSSHFLLGSSNSFSINGSIDTDKVLSCRQCKNEKLVEVASYTSASELFWKDIWPFYRSVDSNDDTFLGNVPTLLLENPIQTYQFAQNNKNWKSDYYNEITNWETEVWAKKGFKINKVFKKYFFFSTKEVYPTWKELLKQN